MEATINTPPLVVDLSGPISRLVADGQLAHDRKTQINWLIFHAELNPATAEAWLDGSVTGIRLDTLTKVTAALGCEVHDIIKSQDQAHE